MYNDFKEIFHGTCKRFNKTVATFKRKYHAWSHFFQVYAIFTTKENNLSVTSLQKAYRFLLFHKPITLFPVFVRFLFLVHSLVHI